MLTNRITLIAAAILIPAFTGQSSAALVVTNGTFGTVNQNALVVHNGGWFESSTTVNWREGSWANPGSYPLAFPGGSGMALIMDSLNDGSYVYQSLGLVGAFDGVLTLRSDFAEKNDGNTNDARFDLIVGNAFVGAHGSDIFGAGGTTIVATFTLTAAQQGLTAAAGNQSRATNVLVGSYDLTPLNVGDQLWLRITDATDGTDNSGSGGDLILDNVTLSVTEVPTPAALPMGAGVLTIAAARRRTR